MRGRQREKREGSEEGAGRRGKPRRKEANSHIEEGWED